MPQSRRGHHHASRLWRKMRCGSGKGVSASASEHQNPAADRSRRGALTVTWGADLQALHAKLLHYSFAQDIGIEFAGLRKFDNSLGDQFIRNIAAVCKSKS
jgi:hypothetical protein